MEKELIQLFEAAKKAAVAANAKGSLSGQAEASRCVDALTKLKTFQVTQRVLDSARITQRLQHLTKHKNREICSSASCLLQHWKQMISNQDRCSLNKRSNEKPKNKSLYSSSATTCGDNQKKDKCLPCSDSVKGTDDSRDKIREMLVEALARVYEEVKGDERVSEKVSQCNPFEVAFAVEKAMFEKMGPFDGKMKNKYRSILFNLRDSKNPDLRRRLLLAQVNPERLISMTSEEMASSELQLEIKMLKQRASLIARMASNN